MGDGVLNGTVTIHGPRSLIYTFNILMIVTPGNKVFLETSMNFWMSNYQSHCEGVSRSGITFAAVEQESRPL